MVKKLTVLILALSLLLGGCGWMDGSYVYISRHQEQRPSAQGGAVTVSGFEELQDVMLRMTENGVRKNVIFLKDYGQALAENGMKAITLNMLTMNPLGCYALKDINYEVGTNSGKPAIAVEMIYRHSAAEIRQIRRYQNMENAEKAIYNALDNVSASMVMLVHEYENLDYDQLVHDYAQENPQKIMEIPQVTAALYGRGEARIVELTFGYQTSRDKLRQMRKQVEPVFEAAKLYVSEGASEAQKYNQLYSFLMERFDYKIQPSITPSYSLLHHGVGDSRAFATIYGAMCRSVGLSCDVITGTRDGEPWTWNLISSHDYYYHVDLLRSSQNGRFTALRGADMGGYVWDYSAVPGAAPDSVVPAPDESGLIPAETVAVPDPTEP